MNDGISSLSSFMQCLRQMDIERSMNVFTQPFGAHFFFFLLEKERKKGVFKVYSNGNRRDFEKSRKINALLS